MKIQIQDFRYAIRQLARTPGFTVIVLATLTLAIGATTTVFSIVNGVLLKSLGFARPDRLVYVGSTDSKGAAMRTSPPDLIDYRDRTQSFTGMAAVDGGHSLTLMSPSVPAVRVNAARVGASFFSLLGVDAQAGRTFAEGEDSKGAPKVVVLSAVAWKRYFGEDAGILGRTISLDGDSYVVVGVAPPAFTFPDDPDLWYPAVWGDIEISDANRGGHSVNAIARLRDGVTLTSARRDLAVVASRIAQTFPKHDAGVGAMAVPLRDQIVGDVEAPLWAMLGAVAFVLLIACANIANLFLVRAAARQTEVAVRTALGAGRRQLLSQFLAESLVLGLGGAILGTVMAVVGVHIMKALAPAGLPRIQEIGVDWHVLAFSLLVGVATGIAFGVLPPLYVSGWDVAHALRSGASRTTGNAGRARSALVLAELALGTVLLVGAGLLIRSFERLTNVDPGFRADHLIVFDVALPAKKYEYDAAQNAFADEVEARVSAIPGVKGVAVTANRPFDPSPGFEGVASFTIDGVPEPAPGTGQVARVLPVSPSFFQTMGMSVVRGRVFSDADNSIDVPPVVVINEVLANRYFPGQDPIGKHLTFGVMHDVSAAAGDTVRARGEIVGVVRSPRYSSLATEPGPATFFPYHTLPASAAFVVRTAIEPSTVKNEIRAVVAAVDPAAPTYELQTMDDALAESVARPRFYTMLLAAFASFALLLATLGVYGVVSYTVTQQTRDFGIRIALGARSADIMRLVVGRGSLLIAVGLSAGIGGAVVLTPVIRGLLFGVEPLDATTFGVVCLLFAFVATVASWLPARRAARLDPLLAMRSE